MTTNPVAVDGRLTVPGSHRMARTTSGGMRDRDGRRFRERCGEWRGRRAGNWKRLTVRRVIRCCDAENEVDIGFSLCLLSGQLIDPYFV